MKQRKSLYTMALHFLPTKATRLIVICQTSDGNERWCLLPFAGHFHLLTRRKQFKPPVIKIVSLIKHSTRQRKSARSLLDDATFLESFSSVSGGGPNQSKEQCSTIGLRRRLDLPYMIRIKFTLRTKNVHQLVHVGSHFVDHIVVIRLHQFGQSIPSVERGLNDLVQTSSCSLEERQEMHSTSKSVCSRGQSRR